MSDNESRNESRNETDELATPADTLREATRNMCYVPGCGHVLASHGQDMGRKPVCKECPPSRWRHAYEAAPRPAAPPCSDPDCPHHVRLHPDEKCTGRRTPPQPVCAECLRGDHSGHFLAEGMKRGKFCRREPRCHCPAIPVEPLPPFIRCECPSKVGYAEWAAGKRTCTRCGQHPVIQQSEPQQPCEACKGTCYVCENHVNHAWEPVAGGERCCGGAGMPCPKCTDGKSFVRKQEPPQPDAKPLAGDGIGPLSTRVELFATIDALRAEVAQAKAEAEEFRFMIHTEREQFISRTAALKDSNRKLRAERDQAVLVLAPNMPQSGLVDACRQVKQVAITEAANAANFEKQSALRADVLTLAHRLLADVVSDPHPVSPRRIKETMRRIEEVLR